MRKIVSNTACFLAGLGLMLAASSLAAQGVKIYKCPGFDGETLFTDQPCRSGEALTIDAGKARPDASETLRRDREALDRGMAQLRARQERERMGQAWAEQNGPPAETVADNAQPAYYYPFGGDYGWAPYGTPFERPLGPRNSRRDRDRQHTVPVRPRNPRTGDRLLPPLREFPQSEPVMRAAPPSRR
ncbi:MAG TPA: hypothetical protein VMV45_01050 [Casimicrobiaceae bacterium]|nr:hypothetical protein [Casimicrobiaceae bacterium]